MPKHQKVFGWVKTDKRKISPIRIFLSTESAVNMGRHNIACLFFIKSITWNVYKNYSTNTMIHYNDLTVVKTKTTIDKFVQSFSNLIDIVTIHPLL